jgi:ubiquinone/menaquinone biosynthesis C-methylase UbiE
MSKDVVKSVQLMVTGFEQDLKDYFRNTLMAEKGVENYVEFSRYLFDMADAKDKRICCVGCGHGVLSIIFSFLGAGYVCGFDSNTEKIFVASKLRSKANAIGVDFFAGDGVGLGVKERSFDVVVVNEVISHVRNRSDLVKECRRILKTGGLMLINDGNNALNKDLAKEQMRMWELHEGGPVDETGLEKPYLEMRKEILQEKLGLKGDTLNETAEKTRGFWGSDLIKAAKHYVKTGTIEKPEFAYINPVTGEYPEFLFDLHDLGKDITSQGFDVIVQPMIPISGRRKLLRKFLRPLYPLFFRYASSFEVLAVKKQIRNT